MHRMRGCMDDGRSAFSALPTADKVEFFYGTHSESALDGVSEMENNKDT